MTRHRAPVGGSLAWEARRSQGKWVPGVRVQRPPKNHARTQPLRGYGPVLCLIWLCLDTRWWGGSFGGYQKPPSRHASLTRNAPIRMDNEVNLTCCPRRVPDYRSRPRRGDSCPCGFTLWEWLARFRIFGQRYIDRHFFCQPHASPREQCGHRADRLLSRRDQQLHVYRPFPRGIMDGFEPEFLSGASWMCITHPI